MAINCCARTTCRMPHATCRTSESLQQSQSHFSLAAALPSSQNPFGHTHTHFCHISAKLLRRPPAALLSFMPLSLSLFLSRTSACSRSRPFGLLDNNSRLNDASLLLVIELQQMWACVASGRVSCVCACVCVWCLCVCVYLCVSVCICMCSYCSYCCRTTGGRAT